MEPSALETFVFRILAGVLNRGTSVVRITEHWTYVTYDTESRHAHYLNTLMLLMYVTESAAPSLQLTDVLAAAVQLMCICLFWTPNLIPTRTCVHFSINP